MSWGSEVATRAVPLGMWLDRGLGMPSIPAAGARKGERIHSQAAPVGKVGNIIPVHSVGKA